MHESLESSQQIKVLVLENPSQTAVAAFEEQGFTVIKHASLPRDKLLEVSDE